MMSMFPVNGHAGMITAISLATPWEHGLCFDGTQCCLCHINILTKPDLNSDHPVIDGRKVNGLDNPTLAVSILILVNNRSCGHETQYISVNPFTYTQYHSVSNMGVLTITHGDWLVDQFMEPYVIHSDTNQTDLFIYFVCKYVYVYGMYIDDKQEQSDKQLINRVRHAVKEEGM